MFALILAISLTVGVSFVCSLWEAMILSTTIGEIESLKTARPRTAQILERLRNRLEDTSSAILTLNTISNTLGSVVVGALATRLYGDAVIGVVSAGMTVGILVFAEVIPKNLGVVHRRALQPVMARPLALVTRALGPVTYLCRLIVRFFVGKAPAEAGAGEEIRLLAERGARHGTLTNNESRIIANALRLDEIRVSTIMTPRNVLGVLRASSTLDKVFREFPSIPFGRMVVYERNLDDIVGIVRRRDLLNAKAADAASDREPVAKFVQPAHFIPETVTAAEALRLCLEQHQRLLVVVDEFGSTAGVLSFEDIMETLLGSEIFERDDVAIDMRELARARIAVPPPRVRGAASPPGDPAPPR
jgi:Hemolysins and related proteins containing CBS domains